MATTFVDIINRTYQEMREYSDSTTYALELTKKRINELLSHIYRGRVSSIIDSRKTYEAGDLRFAKKMFSIDTNGTTTTTSPIAVGDVVVNCVTTRLAMASVGTPKHIKIQGQVLQYTGQNSTQITGVTGIIAPVREGTLVRQVTKLPDDCNKPKGLQYMMNVDVTNWVDFQDSRGDMDIPCYYTILQDSSNSAQFIEIAGYDNCSYPFLVHYYKKFTYLVNDTDLCELPDDFAEKIVANIVAGEWLYTTEQEQQGTALLMKGYANLEQLFSEYSTPVKHYKKTVSVKPMDGVATPQVASNKIIYIRQ